MNSTFSVAKIVRVSIVVALGTGSAAVFAHSSDSYGPAVDAYCVSHFSAQAKPFDANGCNLCHYSISRAAPKEPEWTWYDAAGSAFDNFCKVQGFIVTPKKAVTPPDVQVSQNGTVHLEARGFTPIKGNVPLMTFNWSFSDRPADPPLSGATVDVPMPNVGDIVVTLTASDGTSQSTDTPEDFKARSIRVSNAPTVAQNDKYSVQSGSTLTVQTPGVLVNDTGVGVLTAAIAANPVKGAATLNPNGGFSYTPIPGFAGADSFTYTASNGVMTSAPATVAITVTPAVPVAVDDRYVVKPGKTLTVKAPGVFANDQGSGKLTATLVRNATQGSLALSANGSFTYTPLAGRIGTDSFSYTAKNRAGRSSPATVTLSLGSCADADKDGYSTEGGTCGPIDCDDQNSAVHPGAKEICGNTLDDNCNGLADTKDPYCSGKDCIANYRELSRLLKIKNATWSPDQSKLLVNGTSAVPGSVVKIYNGAELSSRPNLLGEAGVMPDGSWNLEANTGIHEVPCRVRAEVKEASTNRTISVQGKVDGAPASCTAMPVCQ